MNIQLSTLFCLCLAFAIPILVFSTSHPQQQFEEELLDDVDADLNRFVKSDYRQRLSLRPVLYNDHYLLKKAADFEQILKPCNQMPASGRGHEYSDCVRSRMMLMGRRKRRQTNLA